MLVSLIFKMPDVLDQVDDDLPECDEEDEAQQEENYDIKEWIKSYVRNGEYLTVEFNTETKTVEVLKAR